MKKLIILLFISALVFSCTEEEPILELKVLPIKEAKTPVRLQYRNVDTLTLKYTLPNACYTFRNVYYERERNSRVIAINAVLDSEKICTQATIDEEIKIPIHVLQEEDYTFKFFKGKDADGNSIFKEIIVPVD